LPCPALALAPAFAVLTTDRRLGRLRPAIDPRPIWLTQVPPFHA
jgi:hypothetical protein